MEKLIDLHTHSLESDGSMTPEELVRHAEQNGISAIALTDHDKVSGVKRAIEEGKRCGVEVIPGIEISVKSDTETHILGYFIDPDSKALQDLLMLTEKAKTERMKDTEKKLNAIGIDVSYEEARSLAGSDNVGRAHFAKAMVKKGYSSSVQEAFAVYLGTGKPAFSGKQIVTDEQAIRAIHEAGGIAFVAHLHLTHKNNTELREFLSRLKSAGLDGIEGYYTDYTPQMNEEYRGLAKELGLILSGGSDFHADLKPHISIGRGRGELVIPYSVLEGMKAHIEKTQGRKV